MRYWRASVRAATIAEAREKRIPAFPQEERRTRPVDLPIIAGAQSQAKQVTGYAGGALAWPGLLRKLDRIDASYRF